MKSTDQFMKFKVWIEQPDETHNHPQNCKIKFDDGFSCARGILHRLCCTITEGCVLPRPTQGAQQRTRSLQNCLQKIRTAGHLPAPAGACEAQGVCALSLSCAPERLPPADPHSRVRTPAFPVGMMSICFPALLLDFLATAMSVDSSLGTTACCRAIGRVRRLVLLGCLADLILRNVWPSYQ